jgi:hypothetical protein
VRQRGNWFVLDDTRMVNHFLELGCGCAAVVCR